MTEIEIPHHAADPVSRRVGVLVSVVGIVLAVVTIAAHRSHTQAVIHRTEANDQWAYYQAKKIRENTSDIAVTLMSTLAADPGKASAAIEKLTSARDKYANDAKSIQSDAQAKDEASETEEHRALYYDFGEGMLELGLVLCSLYFLSRNVFFPFAGIVAALGGSALGLAAAFGYMPL